MNKSRIKRIQDLAETLKLAHEELGYIIDEESYALYNMPENLQETKKWQQDDKNLSELDDIKEGVLEIKTGQIYDHDWACGQMPEHYFAQVCQYLLVTGCEFAKVEGLKGRLQEVVYA